MCGHVLAMAYMWRSEANGSRDRTQVLRLDSKYPHPVNHLSGPQPFCPPQNGILFIREKDKITLGSAVAAI